jgi:hypothetical protein
MKKTLSSTLLFVGIFVLFLIGMGLVQFAVPDLPDNDGFYHIKLAAPEFTWLPLSILNAREFYDHHFLFHVLLIPFTFGDLRLGAKLAAVSFAALAFLAVGILFQRQRLPWAWLWALGLLGISDAFLYRMSITRAQSLSLGILALAFIFLLERRLKPLGILAFLYVWTYNAFPLILAIGFLHFVAVWLVERRFDLKPLLYIALGVGLGVIVNPYFPQNLVFSYHHMLPKLTDATSVSVGSEWYPYNTKQLLENSLPALAAFASGMLALGLTPKKMDTRTAFALLTALLFGLMLFQARRFVEYFPPFALFFAAFAWTPLLEADTAPQTQAAPAPTPPAFTRLRPFITPILLGLAVIVSSAGSIPRARDAVASSKPYDLYAGASEWLRSNTPAGARVFQTDWDDFPRLFFYNTHNTYLVGLDPTYLQLYNPELYDQWVAITQGRVAQPAGVILETFGARYIHTDLKHGDFLQTAAQDPGLREVYRDDQAVIFEVTLP